MLIYRNNFIYIVLYLIIFINNINFNKVLQKCLWIICFVLDVEKVLYLMRRLLIQMENYGILNVLCKN